MIGDGYWATGITVEYSDSHKAGWCARLKFLDVGFVNDDPVSGRISTEGELRTRYYVPDGEQVKALPVVLDALIVDAARLGITFRETSGGKPMIYYHQDGEDVDRPPPEGWLGLLAAEAQRLGWSTYQRASDKEQS